MIIEMDEESEVEGGNGVPDEDMDEHIDVVTVDGSGDVVNSIIDTDEEELTAQEDATTGTKRSRSQAMMVRVDGTSPLTNSDSDDGSRSRTV